MLLEQDLKEALNRLNPEIPNQLALADEVIYKLRAVIISVNQVGLVKANEEFFKWMTGEKTIPYCKPFVEPTGSIQINHLDEL